MNRNIGKLAAIGNAAARRSRLTLTLVERELGELTTIADAQRSLARIRIWAMAGLRSGSQCAAALQACREWIVGEKAKDEHAKLAALIEQQTQRIQELERENARLRRRTT